jgi:hypothetical protein
MKQQYIVTHTIRQTEIPSLHWVTNTPSVKMLCPQKISSPYIFRKNTACVNSGLINDLSSFFFCLLYNCVSVGYEKLLFHEREINFISCTKQWRFYNVN